jgi:PD-(D/E)XK nuclease superfamily
MKGSANARKLQIAIGVLMELKEDKCAGYIEKLIAEKLQESIDSDVITERNLTIQVLGWTISGTFDRYTISQKLLEDYKTGSANASMVPETKKAWNAQLNVYAVMLRENGLEVAAARIIAILKDWSKMRLNVSRDYPRTPVIMHNIPLEDHGRVMEYIEKRVKLHQRAEAGEQIPCTAKDRWAKPDSWAVRKIDGKKALKLFDHPDATAPWIQQNKHKYAEGELVIEHRKGESFRCANGYCPVSEFCPQYAEEKRLAAEAGSEM